MLNLLKKNKINKELNESYKTKLKHFPSSVREWNNSIYIYNKNNLNLIPCTTFYVMKIIQSFFNFYNKSLEKKIRTKRLLLRLRRLSSNRIYLSNGEFKHKNNNVLINIYIFNRQKYNYIFSRDLFPNIFSKKLNSECIDTLNSIYLESLSRLKKMNKDKYFLLKTLDILNKKYKINTLKSLSNYTSYFYKKVLDLTIKKFRLFFLYKQLIYINKSKLNYTYLRLLKKHLENFYNKNVEFNLINLKRFYLNSDIFSESVKLKLTRNKLKMRNILKKLKNKIYIHKKNLFLDHKNSTYLNLNDNNTLSNIKDTNLLKYIIFNSLKYKHITGFKIQAKGRLGKRYTASRSVTKLQFKGNLLNIDSSYKGISSVILKGNLKSNLQYTKLSSKTRIGSFGIKGWISSD